MPRDVWRDVLNRLRAFNAEASGLMSLNANYSVVIVSLLNHAWIVFGPFTAENQAQVSRWVQGQMQEIREWQTPSPPPMPSRQRAFTPLVSSEPNEDGWL